MSHGDLNLETGNQIEHNLLPGFRMTILDTADCEVDTTRPDPHKQYKVIDLEGAEDWLCAYDVQQVGGRS